MSNDQTHQAAIDLLRLNDAERKAVDEYLAREPMRRSNAKNSRVSPRFRYVPKVKTHVELIGLDGGAVSYQVLAKDLSATGVAFLHGSFVYPGTRCTVALEPLDGAPIRAAGSVVRCGLIAGRVHEVGVRFEKAIALEAFVTIDAGQALNPGAAGLTPPEKLLDTPGVRRLIAEIAALAGHRDCPVQLRNKALDLARMGEWLVVAAPKDAKKSDRRAA